MDFRRDYDYQNGMMYGRDNQTYRNEMPYNRDYQDYQMMNRPYAYDNFGQMPYYNNPMFEDRNDADDERDIAYMREMYPEQVKTIMRQVEEICDRMDYEGSMIYDEYPDKMMLRRLCNEVYEKVRYMDMNDDSAMMPEQNGNMMAPGNMMRPDNSGNMMTPENNGNMMMPEQTGGSMGMMSDVEEASDDMTMMQYDGRRRQQCFGPGCNPFRNLVEVLLHQELRRRRHRRRARRRYW